MIQLIGQRAALSGFMILLEDPLEENIEERILKKKNLCGPRLLFY